MYPALELQVLNILKHPGPDPSLGGGLPAKVCNFMAFLGSSYRIWAVLGSRLMDLLGSLHRVWAILGSRLLDLLGSSHRI